VALVRTDVSEEPGTSFIRVTKIGELGTTQAATSNPEDTILLSFTFYFTVSFYKFCVGVEYGFSP
jgi:hypothetical protein